MKLLSDFGGEVFLQDGQIRSCYILLILHGEVLSRSMAGIEFYLKASEATRDAVKYIFGFPDVS
jgi:hypothetical protein